MATDKDDACTLSEGERAIIDAVPTRLSIGGKWRDAAGGGTLVVEDPATGARLAAVADATPDDGIAALDAACDAAAAWAATSPRERSELLHRVYELVIEHLEELALLITLEMGKPLEEARGEVRYSADYLRWFSGEAVRIEGRYGTAERGGARVVVSKAPVGPCLLVTPWNFPLAMGARKIAPALAAGCTAVVKPAEQTPLSMLRLAALLEQAGLPAGVVNVVTTTSAPALVTPLITDPRLRKVSFTGSTAVGKLLMRQASDQLLRLSMELGGNAPFLVFADADVEAAVEGAMLAKMRNGGEACTAANRFFVHERVADQFAERLTARMSSLRLGRGTDPGVELGPLIDGTQRGRVASLVADAVAAGAVVGTGGAPVDGPGYFHAPTVLLDVPGEARLVHEEIFGPVAPIVRFSDDEEAIARANDTPYGLVAYLYTRDLDRGLRAMEAMDTGMVALNQGIVSSASAPFGGVKHSGFGREGGREGIDDYLTTKYAAVRH